VRSESELAAAAGHITYEIEMLAYTREELGGFHRSPETLPEDHHNKDMALESFLVHFRNLRAFLCPNTQKFVDDDDVIASDLLKEQQPRDLADAKSLSVDQPRMNKMLAHISYKRDEFIATGNDGWEVATMLLLMLGQLESFFAMLSPTERAWFPTPEWIAESKSMARSVLSTVTTTGPVYYGTAID
jgi:hypothetical protein